jgi:glycosyltransferase involved in cell wall biosynthesis
MKIFVIADYESDWYPKNAITLFKKYSSFEFVEKPEDSEIIWIFSYYCPLDNVTKESGLFSGFKRKRQVRRKKSLDRKLFIASFHHLNHEKESSYLSNLEKINAITDLVHFFSKINIGENRHYFEKPIILLPYWIDTTMFRPIGDAEKKSLKVELGIPEGKMIIGSFQRDTEADLVSAKIEKGPDTFCSILEALPRDGCFALLAGPRRHYIENRLLRAGIEFLSLGKFPYDNMWKLYGCLDYYLVTSRCEGGPQAILEAMATKTKIFSTKVGVSDLLSDSIVFSESSDFSKALMKQYPNVIEHHYNLAQEYNCSKVVKKFEQCLTALLDCHRNQCPPEKDDILRNILF